jgi:hypothetical protein
LWRRKKRKIKEREPSFNTHFFVEKRTAHHNRKKVRAHGIIQEKDVASVLSHRCDIAINYEELKQFYVQLGWREDHFHLLFSY